MVWLDDFGVTNAEFVPLHRKDVLMKSWKDEGLDFGIIQPSELDVRNILINKKITPIESSIWKNLNEADPEGYYAIGYPRLFNNFQQTQVAGGKILCSVAADLVCIPLREIPPPLIFKDNPMWANPNAFYGEIIPFPDLPLFDIEDGKGMSGGPIISIERNSEGRVVYRLVGVIQSFAYAQSIFRAEPIDLIAKVIDGLFDQK